MLFDWTRCAVCHSSCVVLSCLGNNHLKLYNYMTCTQAANCLYFIDARDNTRYSKTIEASEHYRFKTYRSVDLYVDRSLNGRAPRAPSLNATYRSRRYHPLAVTSPAPLSITSVWQTNAVDDKTYEVRASRVSRARAALHDACVC